MNRRQITERFFRMVASGAAALLYATVAHGAHSRAAACKAAYKRAQQSEKAGQLREAQALLLTCAESTCGAFVQQACTTRYTRLDGDIPSIIPMVTDDMHRPKLDVEVAMDGEVLTSRIDGRSLQVDPGLHEFSFRSEDGVFDTRKLMILQGERNRRVEVSFPGNREDASPESKTASAAKDSRKSRLASALRSPDPAHHRVSEVEPPRTSGPPALGFVFTGLGVAGIGGYALLVHWGRQDNLALSGCSPNCPKSSVDHIRTLYVAADVSLGVGIASLGVATWLFVKPRSREEVPRRSTAYVIDVQPVRSGAVARIAGSF